MNSHNLTFEFTSYYFDFVQKEALFVYRVLEGQEEMLMFEETIKFDDEISQKITSDALDNLLQSVHFMLGISYWKLYCPRTISILMKPITKDQAKFWNTVYTKGLGEFFYRNNIDFRGLINFPFEERIEHSAVEIKTKKRSLVGIGGGKDSIVAAELLQKAGKNVDALIMETQKPHSLSNTVIELMQIGTVKVQRFIDPKLFENNTLPGAYNGHIPFSAVFAFVGILTAALYDYRYVIVGNERSANSENLIWLDEEINHQWSKSAEFEALLQRYTKHYITADITYFSLLRPLSEIQIVEKFAKMEKYFHTFSSCNRNFKVHKETGLEGKLWCGECPKCAFVFALLAAFLPKQEVVNIFKKNLYSDSSLEELFKELLGLTGKKPFECVGTFEEMRVAMHLAFEKGEYKEDAVMKMFSEEIAPKLMQIEELKKEVFSNEDKSLIPEEFQKIV